MDKRREKKLHYNDNNKQNNGNSIEITKKLIVYEWIDIQNKQKHTHTHAPAKWQNETDEEKNKTIIVIIAWQETTKWREREKKNSEATECDFAQNEWMNN